MSLLITLWGHYELIIQAWLLKLLIYLQLLKVSIKDIITEGHLADSLPSMLTFLTYAPFMNCC